MRKNLVTITGGETRHKFLSAHLSRQENINILLSIQEKVKKLKDNKDLKKYSVFKCHIRNRKKTEEKYFPYKWQTISSIYLQFTFSLKYRQFTVSSPSV